MPAPMTPCIVQDALQATTMDTQAEIEQCAQLRASLEQRLARVQEKAQLNETRLQVSTSSIARNCSCDSSIRHGNHSRKLLLITTLHCLIQLAGLYSLWASFMLQHACPLAPPQVRQTRPAREKTMDGVEGLLLKQQGLVSTFEDKVRRYSAAVERQVQHLEHCKVKLVSDLRGKVSAISSGGGR